MLDVILDICKLAGYLSVAGLLITIITGAVVGWFRFICLPMVSWMFKNYKED